MLTLGIDDAGRGPLIGPMVLAGALLDETQEKILRGHNVRDSKDVIHSDRIRMFQLIKDNSHAYKIVKTSASKIDSSLNSGTNLNTLEAKNAAEIINSINCGKFREEKIKVIIDCPSVNTLAWCATVKHFVEHLDNLNIKCEHKADVNYISAAAGSILAKVTREEEVGKIKKEFGNVGSGYPSDPNTKRFLREHGAKLKDSGIFRKTWATWKKLFPESDNQKTLF